MKNRAQGETNRMTKPNETERNPNTLTRRQHAVLPHLVCTASLEEGCRRAGVSKTTIYKWLKNSDFQAELKRLRQALVADALERLKTGLTLAVNKLLELLQAEGQVSIQFRAAHALVDHGLKAVEMQDLEQRIATLEQHLSDSRNRR